MPQAGRDTEAVTEGSQQIAPGDGLRERLSSLSVESLLWTMSFFCTFMGAFLLVAPHHFQTPPYRVLLYYSVEWGSLALISGVGLLAVAILRPSRGTTLLVYGMAGATLFCLAASFGGAGSVRSALIYTLLGAGVLLAGWLIRDRSSQAGGDLFGLLMGLTGTAVGFLLAAPPELIAPPVSPLDRTSQVALGVFLLLTGPPLVYAQLAPRLGRRQVWASHLAAGAAFIALGTFSALPARAWTGLALYCGGGIVIACLPWLRGRMARVDTSTLRTRLALALAVASSLALIVATAVVAAQEERLAERQALQIQTIEAQGIARNVADYIELSAARASTVAALAGRAPTEGLGRLLAGARQSYPNIEAFTILDPEGRMFAANGTPLPPRLMRRLAQGIHDGEDLRVQLVPLTLGGRVLLLLGTSIRDGSGKIAGVLVAAIDSQTLSQRIAREGSRVSLADGHGGPIAVRDGTPRGAERLPTLPEGWDKALPAGRTLTGIRRVAGFAKVPGLGWGVAVERPRASALAGVRRGRDLAFGLLLLVVPLAVLAGIIVSRRIARPLGELSQAVDELTAGNPVAPIPEGSGITEVARLSAAFREMRDRLAARTRESERLAAELRARAEALAETDRRKDEFLAMLAHELRNPLGAIANASYLLEHFGTSSPQIERPVAIIRRQIQHLVRLVDDLLDVSRITRGKVELRRQPVDLMEIVQQAVETTRPLAEGKFQSLRLTVSPEPLHLEGDPTRLDQVLSNLLRNAVKFTEPKGYIEVSARRENGQAVVQVKDDGIGIAPDLLLRVFDLFAQGEQSLDRSGAGLGIGLTLVRSLVEMHGGHVEVRSDGPGHGSEFEIRLPLVASS